MVRQARPPLKLVHTKPERTWKIQVNPAIRIYVMEKLRDPMGIAE